MEMLPWRQTNNKVKIELVNKSTKDCWLSQIQRHLENSIKEQLKRLLTIVTIQNNNHWNSSIAIDTGQHSQFLRCFLYFFFHYDEKLSHCCAMPPPSSDNIDIGLLCHFFFFSRALSHPIRAQKYSLPIAEMLSAPLEKYFPAKNILYVTSKFWASFTKRDDICRKITLGAVFASG